MARNRKDLLMPSQDACGVEEDRVYSDNLQLSRIEYLRQQIYLRSMPRNLSLVLGNGCNIDCTHCYQPKNGDNLLKPAGIARELRREFASLYPFLATLRVQGGEAFAYAGFGELVEDVAAAVRRPILSVSTNGTLIDERWAERIVRMPFRTVTISIDGATEATYARLRRGAQLRAVLANIQRIQRWKQQLASEMPYLDSFFVVMRSNFREIPEYLELMLRNGIADVSLQVVLINQHNTSREPTLERDEVIADEAEVRELYALLQDLLPRARQRFRMIRTTGMTSIFEAHGLDARFLAEECQGLYPDSDDVVEAAKASPAAEAAAPECEGPGVALCPNPWTTLFVAENGDVHLCFLSAPVGNLYEAPLVSIWNCQQAMAKRSAMLSGRYRAAGCDPVQCSWREGKKPALPASAEMSALRDETKQLTDRAMQAAPSVAAGDEPPAIAAVRRTAAFRERRIKELEAMFIQLCESNAAVHDRGQEHINRLERRVKELEDEFARLCESNAATHAKGQEHIDHLEQLRREHERLLRRPLVRVAVKASRVWARLRGGR
jgi:MoaA/NifB/PqqE/SkfB family radical SAM enzyme